MKARTHIILLAISLGIPWLGGRVLAWETTVNGRPSSDMDDGMSVAVDWQTGSVFVGGRRQATPSESRFFVTKFDRAGTRLWHHEIAGTSDLGTRAGATATAVDCNGFLIVAGSVGNSNSGSDIVVVKLDGRSQRKRVIWTRVLDVFGADDHVSSIALTPDGSVVVAGGTFVSTFGGQTFYVMKLTADGQDAWPAPQNLAGTIPDGLNVASAVGVLSNGDIAVTGSLANAGTNRDFVVGRFDAATGERRWLVALNDSRSNGNDSGHALVVAPNDDIVVGGTLQGATAGPASGLAVVRFSDTGIVLWQKVVEGTRGDVTLGIAPSGEIVAGGALGADASASNMTESKLFILSLTANGVERWRSELPGPTDFNGARGVAFDLKGNPVVTGILAGWPLLTAFTVAAFDRDTGSRLWSLSVGGTAPLMNEGRAIVSDPERNAVVAVGVTQNERTSFDVAVTHITDGHEDWRQFITGRGKREDRDDAALAIALDPRRKRLAVAGSAQNTGAGLLGTPREFRIVKIRNDGKIQWKYDLHDSQPHVDNAATALAIDESGDIFAAGRTCAVSPLSCFTVVRISRRGKELWQTIVPGASVGPGEARAILQDPQDGNLIAVGRLGPFTARTFAVVKLDAHTGQVMWFWEGSAGTASALALTSRGTVAVAGMVNGAFGVLEFDTCSGELVSTGAIAGVAGEARAVAFDRRDGTVVAAGSVGSGFTAMMTAVKFSGTGALLWSRALGVRAATTIGETIALHPENGAVAVGGSLAKSPQSLFTVVVLDQDGAEQWRTAEIAGAVRSVAFAASNIVAFGHVGNGVTQNFAIVAFTDCGSEAWRRTFPGAMADLADSSYGGAVEDGTIFGVGTVTNVPTYRDMFVVGLNTDGTDLPGDASVVLP